MKASLVQITVESEFYDMVKVAEGIIRNYFRKIDEVVLYEILSINLQYWDTDEKFELLVNIIVNDPDKVINELREMLSGIPDIKTNYRVIFKECEYNVGEEMQE